MLGDERQYAGGHQLQPQLSDLGRTTRSATANAQGTITPAPLTINAVTDFRLYDGCTNSSQTPTYDPEQVLGTDSVTGLTQAFESKDVLGANGSTLVVTGYTINDGNNGNDYAVTLNTAQGTITPAPLTINAVTEFRTYDGFTDSSQTPTYDPEQVLGTDSVTGLTQAFSSKDVLGTNGSTLVGHRLHDQRRQQRQRLHGDASTPPRAPSPRRR